MQRMPFSSIKESLIMPKAATVVVDLSENLEVWAYYKWCLFWGGPLCVSSTTIIASFDIEFLTQYFVSVIGYRLFKTLQFLFSKYVWDPMSFRGLQTCWGAHDLSQRWVYCSIPNRHARSALSRTIEFSIALNSWSFSVRWAAPQTNTLS